MTAGWPSGNMVMALREMMVEKFPFQFSFSWDEAEWVVLCTLLVATLVFLFGFKKTIDLSNCSSSSSKILRPPRVKAAPVIGGLLKFLKGPVVLAQEQYEKLGPVFTCNLVMKDMTFLIGSEVCEHFFKASESEVSQREVYRFTVPTFGPDVAFAVDHSIRFEQYRFFMESLRVNKVKDYVAYMVEEAEEYFGKWDEEGETDLKEDLEKLIILTASRCLLGLEVRQQLFDEVSQLFYDLARAILPITLFFPNIPVAAHRKRDRAHKRLKEIFSSIIRKRKESGKVGNDMLQSFMDSKYKSGRSTTDSEVTGMLLGALFAGQHTSHVAASWTGIYLMSDEIVRCQAQMEQLESMEKYGKELSYDSLQEMEYLNRVLKEALRLHSPVGILLRYSHKDFTVQSGGKTYIVPKGNILAVMPTVAGKLEHVFPNPDTFDPDRYIEGREEDKKGGPYAYTAFGAGRNSCLGAAFAYMQIKTIWSVLLRNYDLHLLGDFPQNDFDAFITGPRGEVRVRYKRRSLTKQDIPM